jgi:hypothetical protein
VKRAEGAEEAEGAEGEKTLHPTPYTLHPSFFTTHYSLLTFFSKMLVEKIDCDNRKYRS